MRKYVRLWVRHNGPLPVDENGIPFHVHHKDGNRKNNDLSNLQALSIRDHYDVHWGQGDLRACWRLSGLLKLAPDEHHALRAALSVRMTERNRQNIGAKNPFYGRKHSDETRARMRGPRKPSPNFARAARIRHERHSQRGENNPGFIGWYETPWGTFAAAESAAMARPVNQISGVTVRTAKRISGVTVRTWCREERPGFAFISKRQAA